MLTQSFHTLYVPKDKPTSTAICSLQDTPTEDTPTQSSSHFHICAHTSICVLQDKPTLCCSDFHVKIHLHFYSWSSRHTHSIHIWPSRYAPCMSWLFVVTLHTHLFDGALGLHGDGGVSSVFLQHADGTDAALVRAAEHVQQPAVYATRASSQSFLWVQESVRGIERCLVVRLHMLLAVRSDAGETRAHSSLLPAGAHVTRDVWGVGAILQRELSCCCGGSWDLLARFDGWRPSIACLLVLLRDVSEYTVDAELRPPIKVPLTQRTRALSARGPVTTDAALAEVVTARRGHGLTEQVQTDGACQLLLSEELRSLFSHHAPCTRKINTITRLFT